MTMFIHFFCLCPLSLTIELNFDISKVAYYKKKIITQLKISDGEIISDIKQINRKNRGILQIISNL